MSRCEDEQMWEKMWRSANVKMSKMWEKMWRWADVRKDVKMRRCFIDPHYWKNPALRRSWELMKNQRFFFSQKKWKIFWEKQTVAVKTNVGSIKNELYFFWLKGCGKFPCVMTAKFFFRRKTFIFISLQYICTTPRDPKKTSTTFRPHSTMRNCTSNQYNTLLWSKQHSSTLQLQLQTRNKQFTTFQPATHNYTLQYTTLQHPRFTTTITQPHSITPHPTTHNVTGSTFQENTTRLNYLPLHYTHPTTLTSLWTTFH